MQAKSILIYILILLLVSIQQSMACTNLLITKGASKDGSVMITYSADSYNFYGELYHYKPAIYPKGATLEVYEWDTGKYLGNIPQAPQTYNVIGNMNEHQLVIAETTFGGRRELRNKEGLIDYGSLMYITLQRAKSAREAINVMTKLVDEYGYYSSGESFSIGDKNEAWILEMIGKGRGIKGAVWVARKIPDGYLSAHANQSRITTFPLNDPENCVYSKDVITFAREMGYYSGSDEDFNFAETYNPLDFGGIRFCDARVWSIFRRANSKMDKYLPYIKGESLNRMPLWIKPDKKISTHDAMQLMRDHYEGTDLDMTKGIAAGPYNMPYRCSPLSFTVDEEKYFNERPISTYQTAFSFVSQSRSNLPDAVGGVLWFGFDDTYMTVYAPMYSSITDIPENYKENIASLSKFNWDSGFWVFNAVSNFIYPRWSLAIDDLKRKQNELEGNFLSKQKRVEETALSLLKKSRGECIAYLTDYSKKSGLTVYNTWKTFFEFLNMKYMDGVVKDEYGNPKRVGYPKNFQKLIVEEGGDAIRYKPIKPEIDESFKSLVEKGKKELNKQNFKAALDIYKSALEVNPNSKEVKEKIEKINFVIKKIEKLHEANFSE